MLTDGDKEIVSPSLLVIPECVESNLDLDLGMADWLSYLIMRYGCTNLLSVCYDCILSWYHIGMNII